MTFDKQIDIHQSILVKNTSGNHLKKEFDQSSHTSSPLKAKTIIEKNYDGISTHFG